MIAFAKRFGLSPSSVCEMSEPRHDRHVPVRTHGKRLATASSNFQLLYFDESMLSFFTK